MKKTVTDMITTRTPDISDAHFAPAQAALPENAESALPHPTTRSAEAFILVPYVASAASVTAHPTSRFALFWQLAWLQANNIHATLVTDDTLLVAALGQTESFGHSGSAFSWCSWQALSAHMIELVAEGDPYLPVLLMPAPFLTDCDIASVLAIHISSEVAVSTVRGRQRSTPVVYITQAWHLVAHWSVVAPALPNFAGGLITGLPLPATEHVRHARFCVPRLGTVREARQLERFWTRHRLYNPGNSHYVRRGISAISQHASLAADVSLRGPVIVGDNVIVGEDAHIGPWAVLQAGCAIGPGAWIEQAVIGAGAVVEPKGCVYRSQVNAGACVRSPIPVLKACLQAGQDTPVLLSESWTVRRYSRGYLTAKRVLDLVVAIVALICIVPIFIIVSLSCLFSQGWPILFRHERLGLEGKRLDVVKFRTMRKDAAQNAAMLHNTPGFKLMDDPRVTRLGRILRKTSIDELPQLFNVIGGGMSLVGPRPIVPKEIMRYGLYGSELLRVLPGMTGLWQVSGRSNTTYAQRVMLDVQYGDTCSLAQDVRILARTLPVVLFQRGAV